ncbi:50S ribosomal protein L34e [Candidatus Micrarchaeota archaeon]|nr:50S ribosomal protein L34e [Candidatus Micrarchaeota archaeon]MBD3418294.1 50S ribosomal protein L34e [Candidatus Micrarchaeota archaeon]
MPNTRNRSTSMKKIKRRAPSGESREYYERRKKGAKKAHCAICKAKLLGVKKTGAKSTKKPERKFGGNLCHKCQAKVVVEAARVKEGAKSIEDVDIIYRKHVEGILE